MGAWYWTWVPAAGGVGFNINIITLQLTNKTESSAAITSLEIWYESKTNILRGEQSVYFTDFDGVLDI